MARLSRWAGGYKCRGGVKYDWFRWGYHVWTRRDGHADGQRRERLDKLCVRGAVIYWSCAEIGLSERCCCADGVDVADRYVHMSCGCVVITLTCHHSYLHTCAMLPHMRHVGFRQPNHWPTLFCISFKPRCLLSLGISYDHDVRNVTLETQR